MPEVVAPRVSCRERAFDELSAMSALREGPTTLPGADDPPRWLDWTPGEREMYLRRSGAVLWGGVGLALIAVWRVVYQGPSPSPVLWPAIGGSVVFLLSGWFATRHVAATKPRQIALGAEGISVRRRNHTAMIPWARFRGRYAGSTWFAGYMWIGYRGVGWLDPGGLWLSRAMSDAVLARPEVASWKPSRTRPLG